MGKSVVAESNVADLILSIMVMASATAILCSFAPFIQFVVTSMVEDMAATAIEKMSIAISSSR
ncbi:MAG: hypothetical protein COS99_07880 [Candidatus Omnitrophica bacterium CG07_land_8_20_14_0_80_42_15]|uniref:Uncharacterized protein n=1 Tax=Candidatus Aquitaenariimonas noxiae TaxID=1974741 RepID=A0A2J0KRG2_9BACT|nr:MAG: hypothetical protein COS99_07880 [Candidatus Omnitrophica bacterium CG07_land_8_20_14_0_80_42_15]